MNSRIIIFTVACASLQTLEAALQNDSIVHNLNEIVVTARKPPVEIIPAQTLSGDELNRLNSNSIADALRYFSGVQVKDYGGVGGIKTVNIRSMGTNHTAVVYDGIELGNAQNGQIDLGQFSLDNMEALSLYNGQKSNILQPAKDFGSAANIYMRSRIPVFQPGQTYRIRATVRTGSFDLINPSAIAEMKISQKVKASLSAEWVNSSGKYKFRYRRVSPSGELAYDTTAVRANGDINATRIELNTFGELKNGSWAAKAYTYNSERGVPGAIVNNVWRRGERIWDSNSFVQARYTGYFGRFTTLNNLKYAFYRTHYVNNDDKQVKIDNLYRQKEIYISSANQFEITSRWNISASYDLMWNHLIADMYNFAKPQRISQFLSAATAFNTPRFHIQASALGTFIHDRVERRKTENKKVFTPAIFISANPIRNTDLSTRAFFKRSFRMPTFNDLYYADMGNSALAPECVTQYNLGLAYSHNWNKSFIKSVSINADAYYNYVKDKIIAYPKGQQFRWTMLNLGRVDIRGIDINARADFEPLQNLILTLRGQYTWQRAVDITNPADNFYRHQIPYIPHHSGSAVLNAQWKSWGANYSWIYVGERYNQQENIRYNYTQPWYTSDISISKDFAFGNISMRTMLEINNIFNQDYDVILNYPMPKRNYRFTITVEI